MVLERDSRAFARVSAEEEEAGQKADKYRRPLSWVGEGKGGMWQCRRQFLHESGVAAG